MTRKSLRAIALVLFTLILAGPASAGKVGTITFSRLVEDPGTHKKKWVADKPFDVKDCVVLRQRDRLTVYFFGRVLKPSERNESVKMLSGRILQIMFKTGTNFNSIENAFDITFSDGPIHLQFENSEISGYRLAGDDLSFQLKARKERHGDERWDFDLRVAESVIQAP